MKRQYVLQGRGHRRVAPRVERVERRARTATIFFCSNFVNGSLDSAPSWNRGTGRHMQTPQTNIGVPPALSLPPGKRRLLIVDDEEMVRMVLRAVLRYGGYQVTEAVDGEDAVAQYAKALPRFDLVLLDLHMPRLNGYDALNRIRQLDPSARAVFLSGGARETEEQTIRHLHGVAFLHKPFENQELLGLVARMLDSAAL